jgi:hypothetical protein
VMRAGNVLPGRIYTAPRGEGDRRGAACNPRSPAPASPLRRSGEPATRSPRIRRQPGGIMPRSMPSSGTDPYRPFGDMTARLCRQTSLTRTNKPKITNYSCRNGAHAVRTPRGMIVRWRGYSFESWISPRSSSRRARYSAVASARRRRPFRLQLLRWC